eukprot:TRINITY_DN8218_c0_g1_i1.p1 TRINITY_DN8218_c0_g1~~TRINITY_DN8218_c0_g1_i1.p1  ORF type:complete len:396 (+),score=107.71 TRINITY_DN8218_c0_g1_i1:407-1594(+)
MAEKAINLAELIFTGVVFSKDFIEGLNGVLKASVALESLSFRSCVFPGDKGFDKLATVISLNQTIESLEFSDCGLTNRLSSSIKKIINGHAKRRDENLWLGDREEKIPEAEVRGLLCLALPQNSFSDQFVSDLLPILNYDQYLRALDLSGNCVKVNGVIDLMGWIHSARNVLNLDLRGNPGYSEAVHKQLMRELVRNIRRSKRDKAELRKMVRKGFVSKELVAICECAEVEDHKQSSSQKKLHKKKTKKREHRNGHLRKTATEEIKIMKETPAEKPTHTTQTKKGIKIALAEDYKSISCTDDIVPRAGSSSLTPVEMPCRMCMKYFKELMQSESRSIALIMENRALKRQMGGQSQLLTLSGIQPMAQPEVSTNMAATGQPETLSLIGHNSSTVRQ